MATTPHFARHDEAQRQLCTIADSIRDEAYERGFARGLELMSKAPAVPGGTCADYQCRSELRWSGLPKPCGCRPAVCVACTREHVVPCTCCEIS